MKNFYSHFSKSWTNLAGIQKLVHFAPFTMNSIVFLALLPLVQLCSGRATPPEPERSLWEEFNVPEPDPEFWTQEKFWVNDSLREAMWAVGDIDYSEEQLKHGVLGDQFRWQGGIIPVWIDSYWGQEAQQRIVQGMNMIQQVTCIRFQWYNQNIHQQYVHIMPAEQGFGCRAQVGRQDSQWQWVKLEPNWHCVAPGMVAHELIHTIGFWHEQQRPDRDQYITVNWQNIPPASYIEFERKDELGTFAAYDYSSIMHYPAYANGIDSSQPTTVSKTDTPVRGQVEYMTQLDAQKINNMYQGFCT